MQSCHTSITMFYYGMRYRIQIQVLSASMQPIWFRCRIQALPYHTIYIRYQIYLTGVVSLMYSRLRIHPVLQSMKTDVVPLYPAPNSPVHHLRCISGERLPGAYSKQNTGSHPTHERGRLVTVSGDGYLWCPRYGLRIDIIILGTGEFSRYSA